MGIITGILEFVGILEKFSGVLLGIPALWAILSGVIASFKTGGAA